MSCCIHFLYSKLFLPTSNLCARGARGQYHDTPKRRSTRCPRHLNSAKRELSLRELKRASAILYSSISHTKHPSQSRRNPAPQSSVKQNPLADAQIPIRPSEIFKTRHLSSWRCQVVGQQSGSVVLGINR